MVRSNLEKALVKALKEIAKETRRPKPDPDKIYELATNAIDDFNEPSW